MMLAVLHACSHKNQCNFTKLHIYIDKCCIWMYVWALKLNSRVNVENYTGNIHAALDDILNDDDTNVQVVGDENVESCAGFFFCSNTDNLKIKEMIFNLSGAPR